MRNERINKMNVYLNGEEGQSVNIKYGRRWKGMIELMMMSG